MTYFYTRACFTTPILSSSDSKHGLQVPEDSPLPSPLLLTAGHLLLLQSLLAQLLRHLDALIPAHLLPLLGRLLLPLNLPLAPPPPVPEVLLPRPELLDLQPRRLHQPSNPPVVLPVAVVLPQPQQAVGLALLHTRDLERDATGRERGLLGLLLDGVRRAAEASLALRVRRVGQHVVLVEGDADVLAVRVARRVAVVFHVAGRHGVNGEVAAHDAVLAGPPMRASLLVDDVARDDELVYISSKVSLLSLLPSIPSYH